MQNTYTSFTQFFNSNPFNPNSLDYNLSNINLNQIPIFTLTINFNSKTQLKNYLIETTYYEPFEDSEFFDFIPAPYNPRPIIKPQFFISLNIYLNKNQYTITNYQEFKDNYLSFCELLTLNPNSSISYKINNK